jgi:hypothetical protein
MHRHIRLAGTTALAGALFLIATPAHAAGPAAPGKTTMQLDFDVTTVTVVTPARQDNWASAQILDGGHLIAVSFDYAVYDDTAAILLGDEPVTHHRAHSQQQTITCSTSQDAVLGDLAPPDIPLPDGVALTDTVTMTFTALVITQP